MIEIKIVAKSNNPDDIKCAELLTEVLKANGGKYVPRNIEHPLFKDCQFDITGLMINNKEVR